MRMQMGALSCGCVSKLTSASASVAAWKAVVAASVHDRGLLPLGAPLIRLCSGWRIWAQLGTKQ